MIADKLLLTALVHLPPLPLVLPLNGHVMSPQFLNMCVIWGHSSPLAPPNPADQIFLYKQTHISHLISSFPQRPDCIFFGSLLSIIIFGGKKTSIHNYSK